MNMNAIWSLIAKINHDDNGDDDNRRMMICTPSLDDRWEGLDGHWLGEDTINPFTPPAPPAHSQHCYHNHHCIQIYTP